MYSFSIFELIIKVCVCKILEGKIFKCVQQSHWVQKTIFFPFFSIAILKVFFVLTLCFPSSSIIDLLWKGKVSFYWATSTKLWKLSFSLNQNKMSICFFLQDCFSMHDLYIHYTMIYHILTTLTSTIFAQK